MDSESSSKYALQTFMQLSTQHQILLCSFFQQPCLHFSNLKSLQLLENCQFSSRNKLFKVEVMTIFWTILTQAYLKDIVDLVPNHDSKANITINQVSQMFWFPSAHKSYVYTIWQSINCAVALCLKEPNIHTLIRIYFVTNHHLSLQ